MLLCKRLLRGRTCVVEGVRETARESESRAERAVAESASLLFPARREPNGGTDGSADEGRHEKRRSTGHANFHSIADQLFEGRRRSRCGRHGIHHPHEAAPYGMLLRLYPAGGYSLGRGGAGVGAIAPIIFESTDVPRGTMR